MKTDLRLNQLAERQITRVYKIGDEKALVHASLLPSHPRMRNIEDR